LWTFHLLLICCGLFVQLSICCRFVVDFVVQLVLQQSHNKLNKWTLALKRKLQLFVVDLFCNKLYNESTANLPQIHNKSTTTSNKRSFGLTAICYICLLGIQHPSENVIYHTLRTVSANINKIHRLVYERDFLVW